MAGISRLNRALVSIPRRAEKRHADRLRATFVDSGVADAMQTIDHQVIYGRRGTGKTHALRYLETLVGDNSDLAAYVDLRTVGSPDGLFLGQQLEPTERASRLLRDLLTQLYDILLEAALEDDRLLSDKNFANKLDAYLDAVGSVEIDGPVEEELSSERVSREERRRGLGFRMGAGGVGGSGEAAKVTGTEDNGSRRTVRTGAERLALNFSAIAKALRDLSDALVVRRVWLLLDEWSSVPPDVQPYLAEFLVRCVLPLQAFTVKIAAIEQQSAFSVQDPQTGSRIGIELGADVAANLDLDDFMVFEQGSDRAREFFLGLFHKHVTSGVEEDEQILEVSSEADLLRIGFSDRRAFDELVRAAEGVPRDALNIAGQAALKAGDAKISVPLVRAAARAWYLMDKEAAVASHADAERLLRWIIDTVIRGKRARGFLVNRRDARSPLVMALFEARVLHLIRRGYSAQDEPGERYDVFNIDYGAYVDLMQTKYEPQGLLATDDEDTFVEVPTQDLRAIRRSVLNLDAFGETLPI